MSAVVIDGHTFFRKRVWKLRLTTWLIQTRQCSPALFVDEVLRSKAIVYIYINRDSST